MSIAEVVITNFEMPTETGFEQYIAQIKLGSDANAIFFFHFCFSLFPGIGKGAILKGETTEKQNKTKLNQRVNNPKNEKPAMRITERSGDIPENGEEEREREFQNRL